MRILHFVPAYGALVDVRLAEQIVIDSNTVSRSGAYYKFYWRDSSDIAMSRNAGLKLALDEGFDYIFMQDSDIFAVGCSPLAMLLDTARDKDATITGAICGLRRHFADGRVQPNVDPFRHGEVYEATKIGTGMILIDCNKVREWDYDGPWFGRVFADKRHSTLDVGEDIFFSRICVELSGILVADGRVPTVHVERDHHRLAYDPNAA